MKCPFVIKVCSRCHRILVANEMNFYKHKKGKWGLHAECKQCRKKYRQSDKGKKAQKKQIKNIMKITHIKYLIKVTNVDS